MPNYWKLVNDVIQRSDVLMLVLDARRWKESINPEIEDKIEKQGKRFLYVVNKTDLIKVDEIKKITVKPCVKLSAKFHRGNLKLLQKLLRLAAGKEIVVGVLGYPNSGKSTVINSLKGRKSASTSRISGHTKAVTKIRIAPNILLLDSPGVFPYMEKDTTKHALLGAVDPSTVKDPEGIVISLIPELKNEIEAFFNVRVSTDAQATLERIAVKKKILEKGGQPDTVRMAKNILLLIQDGKIR